MLIINLAIVSDLYYNTIKIIRKGAHKEKVPEPRLIICHMINYWYKIYIYFRTGSIRLKIYPLKGHSVL